MKIARKIMTVLCSGSFIYNISATEPEIRVGLMSDTHILRTEESCLKSKQAFELFKKHHVDMVVHLGDLADYHYREGYAIYRKIFNEVFGKNPPREIIVYAYHDMTRDSRRNVNWDRAMQEFKQDLKIANDPYDRVVLKGFPFLIYPQCADLKRQEKEIREMIRQYPGKPIFVLDHIPPYDTVDNSRIRAVREQRLERREILDRYPQVVHLSGHIHNSFRNERCIWQGNFTAVNVATLQHWGGRPVNNYAPSRKICDEAMIMEVYRDKIIFRCFSVTDGSEIRPDRPWCIPLPFDPKTAPYNMEYRRRHSPAPVFPARSGITVSPIGKPFREIEFSFPEAEHPDGCYLYRAELAKKNSAGQYETIGFKEDFGGFYLKNRQNSVKMVFDAGFFDSAGDYRITVIPQDFYGNRGVPLLRTFTAGEPERGEVRFESFSPMKDCPYRIGLNGGEPVKRKGDFYLFSYEDTRLVFPEKTWDGPVGTRFRFIVDMSTEQLESSSLTLVLHDPGTMRNVRPRLITPSGKNHHYRMVIEFTRKHAGDHYVLLLREGLPGKIAFHYIRIERILP